MLSPALQQVYMAEEARDRRNKPSSNSSTNNVKKDTFSKDTFSPLLSPRSDASYASAAGMSAMSLDSNLTQGTDSSGGFGEYLPLYQIIRRLLLHDMCRSWRKRSSRLFDELLQMASLGESSATEVPTAATSDLNEPSEEKKDKKDKNEKKDKKDKNDKKDNKEKKATTDVVFDFVELESAAPVRTSLERDKDNVFHPITFVASVLEDLMDSIETSPQMPLAPSFAAFNMSTTADTVATTNTMRNLVSLFDTLTHRIMISETMQEKHMAELAKSANVPLNHDLAGPVSYANTPELMSRAVGAVSALAAKNESVRSKMNETGLLAVQEQLLMHCLSPFMLSSWDWDIRIHPILSMEAIFERAAVSKSFVTGNGVLFLVQLFFEMTTIQPLITNNILDGMNGMDGK